MSTRTLSVGEALGDGAAKLASLADHRSCNIPELFHALIDDACGRYCDLGKYGLPLDVMDAWRDYLSYCIRFDILTKPEIDADLRQLEAPSFVDAVFECVNSRHDDMRASLINSLGQLSQTHLEDFDWRLHVCISSDKSSVLNKPLALVDLCLKHPDGTTQAPREHMKLELTRDQLAALVAQFDTIQAAVQELKL
ncbi:COMM domain containing 8 [Pelomyxa schiedti]|nr:COMM domain containing 8 [Pelomyxa schiedti]